MQEEIVVKGAKENNLKNINVKIPLNTMTVVTGVSGGRTVIIAQTEERGLVASCMVTVQEYVSSVKCESPKLAA